MLRDLYKQYWYICAKKSFRIKNPLEKVKDTVVESIRTPGLYADETCDQYPERSGRGSCPRTRGRDPEDFLLYS